MSEADIYDPTFVRKLFDEMSGTYGVVNLVSSFGFARMWRRQCVRSIAVPESAIVVDLMTGMGELCPDVAPQIGPHGRIVALDISPAMCQQARKYESRQLACPVSVIEANALGSELPSASADVVVSSFGLKTFSTSQLARLADEIFRILKPSGCFSLVEISVPPARWLRLPYMLYLTQIIPLIGRVLMGNPDNYRLLGVYTKAFGDCLDVVRLFQGAGLETTFQSYFFGCATGLVGRKPDR